jgi:hypothetical protein
MSARTIRLDDLRGRVVHDSEGHAVGRIFEVRAEDQPGGLLIVEYHIGPHALLERLGFSFRRFAGRDPAWNVRKLAWNQLDISDPRHPVVTNKAVG